LDQTLRILHLEDDPIDSELVQALLGDEGLRVEIDRVDTMPDFERLLARGGYALILSDYTMPGLATADALELARGRRPEVPFIFVSGTLGEDLAIEMLKRGASDYVLKQRLARLGPAVRRALEEADEHARRQRAETELRESEERFRTLADNIAQLAWMADASGSVFWYNKRWFEYTGTRPEDMRGWGWLAVHHPDYVQRVVDKLRHSFEAGAAWEDTFPLRGVDGTYRWFLSRAIPIRDAQGRVCRWLGTNTDITELREAEDVLIRAKAAAEAASVAKSQFLANMSHEIRTPMTAILGFAELLSQGDATPEEGREYLAIIRQNGEVLLQLINDILDLSRIEAEKLVVQKTPCNPRKVLEESLTVVRARAAEKGLRLTAEADACLPQWILTDPDRLRQILVNLVSNAVKFTDRGAVQVKVWCGEADSKSPVVRFAVSDTGIGIAPEALPRVFERFIQADMSHTRRYGGSGLGLAISQWLARELGGAIEVESEPGHGSTFTLSIDPGPVEDLNRGHLTAEVLDAAGPTGPRRFEGRVLLAEDTPATRHLVRALAGRAGLEIDEAETGREACHRALQSQAEGRPYALILMDVQMPELDGLAATRQLRDAGWTGPIVALTAHAMAGDREKCLAAGCNDYLAKPVSRGALLEVLGRHLPAAVSDTERTSRS
jgi:PAS domain S-box-containing protein